MSAGHGYEYPADGFGIRGVALEVKPGETAQIKVKRVNIAERLYRVTGEGIYEDSVRLGRKVPIKQPLLNGQVTGQDSAQSVVVSRQDLLVLGRYIAAVVSAGKFWNFGSDFGVARQRRA